MDSHTVKVFSKWGKSRVFPTEEEIESAFTPKDGEQHVFNGLNVSQRKEVMARAKRGRRTEYRTFLDLMAECRPALDQFYVVVEQIPIWFNAQAEKGYTGGTSIANRPRVETFLTNLFGEAGNAAIHLYVLYHYSTMFQKENGETLCGSAEYLERFQYDVWWDLTIMPRGYP